MRSWRVPVILIGLVLVMGILVSFGLADTFDRAILRMLALREGKSPEALIDAARFFSWVGNGQQRITLMLLLAAWLVWQKRTAAAIAALVVPALAGVTSTLLKMLFGRARPDLVPHLDQVHDLSFPSGHATSGFATFVLIALLLPAPIAKWLKVPLILIACAIALSRPMLGVHWPSDIVAGGLLGVAAALIGVTMVAAREKRNAGELHQSPADQPGL